MQVFGVLKPENQVQFVCPVAIVLASVQGGTQRANPISHQELWHE